MQNKIKLDVIEGVEFNYLIIGIVSVNPIFTLSWQINKYFDFDLAELEPISFFSKKLKKNLNFLQFLYFDTKKEIKYQLIQNKNSNGIFIDKEKNVDYLFVIESEEAVDSKIINDLRNIDNINTAFEIKFKSEKQENDFILNINTENKF